MNIVKKAFGSVLITGLSLMAASAHAATTTGEDPFLEFQTTIEGWTSGALGTGLAMTMLLMGAGIGVAKNNPMPALSGVAGAAFLHWGPDIITTMMKPTAGLLM